MFLDLCGFYFCRFSDYEAFCVWILTFSDLEILGFLGFGDLGILGFWVFGDPPLDRPHPRSVFP